MRKIRVEYFTLVLLLLCAGCGNGSGLAGAPPGDYVATWTYADTNLDGQKITITETNTWRFSPGGKFIYVEQSLEGTYRIKGERVLLTFEDYQGKLMKDQWYFDITARGLERHNPDAGNDSEHLVKIH